MTTLRTRVEELERERDFEMTVAEQWKGYAFDEVNQLTALQGAAKSLVDYWMEDPADRTNEEYNKTIVELIWKLSDALPDEQEPCDECHDTGLILNKLSGEPIAGGVPCSKCGGDGQLDAPFSGSDPSCDECDGMGKIPYEGGDDMSCPKCKRSE
jgi:hypothetical protein